MKRNNKKGFTIVELVIVIAVIGILAAVMIPTFGGIIADANEKADLQEARNTYSSYLADKADEDDYIEIEYVKVNGKLYDVNNSFAIVTAPTGSGYDVLEGSVVTTVAPTTGEDE